MRLGVQAKKLNTHKELELAANQAEPVNQADPVSGPDHDKIEPNTLLVQHVKGQPD